MSDAEFRKYERAVEAKRADAIPGLITAALRTNTPIHKYLPFIYENLTQDAMRTLEGSELMDLRLYRVHSANEAAAIIERTGRVIPSLEIIALNHEITGVAGKNDSDIIVKESVVALDFEYLIRASPIAKIANGQRIQGTVDEMTSMMRKYAKLAASQKKRRASTQTIILAERPEDMPAYDASHFFNLPSFVRVRNTSFHSIDRTACERLMTITNIHELISCASQPLEITQNGNLRGLDGLMLPLVTPRTEQLLGNPNVFEFP